MRISDWSSDVCSSDLGNARRSTWGARFIMVRLFSQWLHGLDTTHEVLPRGLVPSRYCRTHPYIFTPAEIVAIIEEAAQLPSIYGMRGLTCSPLSGLIAVTGRRIDRKSVVWGKRGQIRVNLGGR